MDAISPEILAAQQQAETLDMQRVAAAFPKAIVDFETTNADALTSPGQLPTG